MMKINEAFNNIKSFDGDAYVVDYTNLTHSKKGVEISTVKPIDIHYFHLINKKHIEYWGINFEKNAKFFEKGTNQCECMFASKNAKKKGWVCLIELKYCLEKNIAGNSESAFLQLKETLSYLIEKNLIDLKKHRVYLNISIPDHSHKEPFLSFMTTQDEVINSLKEHRITILGYNEVLIMNEGYLQVPRYGI